MAAEYLECPRCGTAIARTATRCEWCGLSLSADWALAHPAPAPADSTTIGEASTTPPGIRPGHRRRAVASAAAVVVVLVLAALALGAWTGFGDLLPCEPGTSHTCVRVLFIGNSYTYVNDLPSVFRDLARAGGHRVDTGMVAPGGATLADHARSTDTQQAISGSEWQFVVIQEQSEIPSIEQMRQQQMYPAARSLVASARAAGAQPVFFETWAHRDGWAEYGLDYSGMQAQIDAGYDAIGQELGVPVAPVGHAWWVAMQEDPRLGLWQDDGSHPSETGTYLAACVLYATVFRQSPAGVPYHGSLGPDVARMLQNIAAETVLGGASQGSVPVAAASIGHTGTRGAGAWSGS